MGKFDRYAFSANPSFNEAETREAFSHAVPLRTLVIYCYDPRAAEIPNAVAVLFGDEVFPGRVILDRSGNRIASSTTIFPVPGGRAGSGIGLPFASTGLSSITSGAFGSLTPPSSGWSD